MVFANLYTKLSFTFTIPHSGFPSPSYCPNIKLWHVLKIEILKLFWLLKAVMPLLRYFILNIGPGMLFTRFFGTASVQSRSLGQPLVPGVSIFKNFELISHQDEVSNVRRRPSN